MPPRAPGPRLVISTTPWPTHLLFVLSFNMHRGPLAFFGTAVLSGIIFHTLFFAFSQSNTTLSSVSRLQPSSWKDNLPACCQESCAASLSPPIQYLTLTADAPTPTTSVFKDPCTRVDDMTLEEIREMVSKTKGLFARDFSLGLGWNNVGSSFFANISTIFTICV